MRDRNSLNEFFNELRTFLNSDSYAFIQIIKENRLLISLLRDNYLDLIRLLDHHDRREIFELMFNTPNHSFRWKLQRKIIRFLINYLNSLYSFIEYSRKNILPLLENNKRTKEIFERKKAAFTNSQRHEFLMKLRTYSTHNTALKIGSQRSFNIKWEMEKREIFLRKEHLVKWNGWNGAAKAFMESCDDKIYIAHVLRPHYTDFVGLQNFSFVNLLLIDSRRTEVMIEDTKMIIEKAKQVKAEETLPFKTSYGRYLAYLYKKALAINQFDSF